MQLKENKYKNKIQFLVIILILSLFAFLFFYNNNFFDSSTNTSNNQEPIRKYFPIMSTWAKITLYGNKKDVKKAIKRIKETFDKIEEKCNRFNSKSELYKLNKTASDKPFKCSKLLWHILQKSKFFYKLSNGSFDVTITPLMKLWGFYRKQKKIPSKNKIKETKEKIGFNKIKFNKKNRTVFFRNDSLKIDLGGIAKGYAVDLALKNIKNLPIKSGIINLGGNIRSLPNSPPNKNNYKIGIKNPFKKQKLLKGKIKINNRAISTSGNYERMIKINGKNYTHIINPKTGYPVKNIASVTVVTDTALLSDTLSTAIFINGKEFAEKIHKKYPNTHILIIKKQNDEKKLIKIGDIWNNISL